MLPDMPHAACMTPRKQDQAVSDADNMMFSCAWCSGNDINLNGDFLQAGAQAIRVVDPSNLTSNVIGQLDRNRVGVTLTTLGNGNILILGGNQQVSLLQTVC